VLLIRPPGVYCAQSDTALLTEVLRDRVRELPFGPVMRARAALLEGRGLIASGQRAEEIVVVAGARR
jgi:hypothetical protein